LLNRQVPTVVRPSIGCIQEGKGHPQKPIAPAISANHAATIVVARTLAAQGGTLKVPAG
jgi:hypothetical protein